MLRRRPRGLELRCSPSVGARDDEPQLRIARRHLVEGAHEHGQVLARLDRPEREHVTRRAGDRASAVRIAAGARTYTQRDLHDSRVVDREVLPYLPGDELTRRVHRRAAVQRPPDEPAVLQGVACAQLREPDEGQVVDRHDDRTARRRADERGVHDVDRARPAFDTRHVAVQPQSAYEAGGDRADGGADAGRDPIGELLPAPERERVRDQVEVGPSGEGVEEAVGDFADAGRLPQQRRAVDGEPKRRAHPTASQISSGSCSMPSRSRSTLWAGTPARS